MNPATLVRLMVGLGIGVTTPILGQVPVTPGPESTLTVSVSGTAEALADWAEVTVTVTGEGVNTQEALATCEELHAFVRNEFLDLGVDASNIRANPPSFGQAPGQIMMVDPNAMANAPSKVTRDIVIRLVGIDDETMYEDIAAIIDLATDAGATPKGQETWSPMVGGGTPVTLGVNDPKAVRAKAVANGLAHAQEVAELVADASVRKLGAISSIMVQDTPAEQVALYMVGVATAAPARSVQTVMLTVTYRLE